MKIQRCLMIFIAAICLVAVSVAHTADEEKTKVKKVDAKAQALLDAAKDKLRGLDSLVADTNAGTGEWSPTRYFRKTGEVFLQRPNRFRVEDVGWSLNKDRSLSAVSDGRTVTRFDKEKFISYKKPVRPEHFFLGHNFLVQFFFEPEGLRFDPSSSTWGRPISAFENNVEAYDRDVDLKYLGERTMQGKRYDVVEIKYNTLTNDIRQQIYIGNDKLVYQVDSYFDGMISSQKFRNFRLNPSLPAETWSADRDIPKKIPIVDSDPVRMGERAPDFTLPGHDGGEFTFKELLKGSKGMFVSTVDGEAGKRNNDADTVLSQMRMIQEMKDKFEKQGLMVVAIVGGPGITPDLKEEMMLNWMPDVTRFNYPILIDIDLERGIQGSAYENFNLRGRGTLLLDSEGKVVFASNARSEVDKLALYQALAQIGFAVSPADLETRGRFR